MRLSHSKLQTILRCPMTYFLTYEAKIWTKRTKPALSIGSAVHWGIEHETEDLTGYYATEGSFLHQDNYTPDQLLAEAMVHGYLKHKDDVMKNILRDYKTGETLEVIDEAKEIFVKGKIASKIEDGDTDFVGIIDLLLTTPKGFIVIDYKTSSKEPNWDDYLEQIYRYIFLLNHEFPGVPIYKIAIINLKKSMIRQKKKENNVSFLNRLRLEYELNDEAYIGYHIFEPDKLNANALENYFKNLEYMCDAARLIEKNRLWYINYGSAVSFYGGRSDYYDIFYRTPDAHILYNITDKVYDDITQQMIDYRPCNALDMTVIDVDNNVLNKYDKFELILLTYVNDTNSYDMEQFYKYLSKDYTIDRELFDKYWQTFEYLLKVSK